MRGSVARNPGLAVEGVLVRGGVITPSHVSQQLRADEPRVGRRDRLVQFVLGHPVDAHGVAGGCHAAIAAAVDRHEIAHLVGLAELRFALVEGMAYRMLAVRRREDREVRLEQPVAQHAQAFEHGSAKDDGIKKRCPIHVLDDIGKPGLDEHIANRLDKARPLVGVLIALRQIRVGLTRRRGVDGVERGDKLRIELHGIGLNEGQRIAGLRIDIHADDLETGFGESLAGAAGAAEQIEQTRLAVTCAAPPLALPLR